MQSIGVLTWEHGLILAQLENLSLARKHLEAGLWPAPEFFEKALVFSREFADRFHHFKEEFLLFGMLARKQAGRLDTDIGALRFQHERCRQALEEIERALPGYGSHDEFAATVVAASLAAYITLLRRHIFLEDQVFFPLAAEVLTPEDDDELLRHFEEEAGPRGGRDFTAQWRQQVEDMAAMLR